MTAPAGLIFSEQITSTPLALALVLFDAYTGDPRTLGSLNVSIPKQKPPLQRLPDSTFLFFGLPAGQYTVSVASDPTTPYYLPLSIPITLPFTAIGNAAAGTQTLWPAFPGISNANLTIPLDDPAQAQAYLAQRQQAGLQPTAQYPFPPDATLVRGVVTDSAGPVIGAVIRCTDADASTSSDANGAFVLTFSDLQTTTNGTSAPQQSKSVAIQATSGTTQATTAVSVVRGTTVGIQLTLTL
jgi:hypothetical protein